MPSHLIAAITAFAVGIGIYFALPAEPQLIHILWVLTPCALAWLWLRHIALLWLLLACLGFGNAALQSQLHQQPIWHDKESIYWLRGVVENIEHKPFGYRVLIAKPDLWRPETGKLPAHQTPKKLRLNVRTNMEGVAIGNAVQTKVKLSSSRLLPAYPNGYDFARFAYFKDIGATGFTVTDITLRPKQPRMMIDTWFGALRQTVTKRIHAALESWEHKYTAPIATALITAERGHIPKETLEAMRLSGLGHLLAISGLHMALVMMGCFAAIRMVLAAIPRLNTYYDCKKISAIAAIIAGFIFLTIAGFPLSAKRAWIMASLFFTAILVDRINTPLIPVSIAAALLLLIAPEGVLSPSFHMSFAAVTCLVAAYAYQAAKPKEWQAERLRPKRFLSYFVGVMSSSLIASLAVMPYALYHFGRVSALGVIANLLAIPITSFWVMPCAILTMFLMPFGLESIGLYAMGKGIDSLVWIAEYTSQFKHAVRYQAKPPTWLIITITLVGLWLCANHARRHWAIIPLIILLGMLFMQRKAPDIIISNELAMLIVDNKTYVDTKRKGRYHRGTWQESLGLQQSEMFKDFPQMECVEQRCSFSLNGHKVLLLHADYTPKKGMCRKKDIVINRSNKKLRCKKTILQGIDFNQHGTHRIWLDPLRIDSAAAKQGKRFWSP